jgi:hypothetical protein
MGEGQAKVPVWPSGESGTVLSDLTVEKPIDELFLEMQGGVTEYKVRSVSGSEDLSENGVTRR